jgi:hypothetical protein
MSLVVVDTSIDVDGKDTAAVVVGDRVAVGVRTGEHVGQTVVADDRDERTVGGVVVVVDDLFQSSLHDGRVQCGVQNKSVIEEK